MLSELIKAYREQNRISVRTLAKRIGITYQLLWRFEEGREIESCAWVKIMVWVLKGEKEK